MDNQLPPCAVPGPPGRAPSGIGKERSPGQAAFQLSRDQPDSGATSRAPSPDMTSTTQSGHPRPPRAEHSNHRPAHTRQGNPRASLNSRAPQAHASALTRTRARIPRWRSAWPGSRWMSCGCACRPPRPSGCWRGRRPGRSGPGRPGGAGGLGHLLAQQLVAAGERVLDVQPKLGARVRPLASGATNKSDPSDARSVAAAALRSAGGSTRRPRSSAQSVVQAPP